MIALDLTARHPVRLMLSFMHDTNLPSDALHRFTVTELGQILALSRFSRRPVKKLLHAKGLSDSTESVDAFLKLINSHPQYKSINELADIIEMPLRFYAK